MNPTTTPLGRNLQLRTLPLTDTAHLYVRLPDVSGPDPFGPVNVQALEPLTPEQAGQIWAQQRQRPRDLVEILRVSPAGLLPLTAARPTARPGDLHSDLRAAVTLLTTLHGQLQAGTGPSEGTRFLNIGPLYGRLSPHLTADLSDVRSDYRVRPFGSDGEGAPCWLIGGVDVTSAGLVRWQIELPEQPAVDG